MIREKVEGIVQGALEKDNSLFLIDLIISEDNQIAIILDGDKGISVDDCIKMSREIEQNLDREEEDYSLQVMSAGVSEPLTLPRQYKKNIGRVLKVKTLNGQTVEGELKVISESGITLNWKSREPKAVGKGKVTVQKTEKILFQDIKEAKVMITFN